MNQNRTLNTEAKVQAMWEFLIWLKDAEALTWGNECLFQRHSCECISNSRMKYTQNTVDIKTCIYNVSNLNKKNIFFLNQHSNCTFAQTTTNDLKGHFCFSFHYNFVIHKYKSLKIISNSSYKLCIFRIHLNSIRANTTNTDKIFFKVAQNVLLLLYLLLSGSASKNVFKTIQQSARSCTVCHYVSDFTLLKIKLHSAHHSVVNSLENNYSDHF